MLLAERWPIGLAKRFSWPVRLPRWNAGVYSTVGAVVLAFIVALRFGLREKRGVLLSARCGGRLPICAALLHVGMDALLSYWLNCFGRCFNACGA